MVADARRVIARASAMKPVFSTTRLGRDQAVRCAPSGLQCIAQELVKTWRDLENGLQLLRERRFLPAHPSVTRRPNERIEAEDEVGG
jgi:hypothetical protein